jgi:hypothetical protein
VFLYVRDYSQIVVGVPVNVPVKLSLQLNITKWEKRNRWESDDLQDRRVLGCQFVPLRLSYKSILLDWVVDNKGLACFCRVLAFCSGKAIQLVYIRLPEVGRGLLCCSLSFASRLLFGLTIRRCSSMVIVDRRLCCQGFVALGYIWSL